MMNCFFRKQQFKALLFVPSLFTLLVAAPAKANAIDIKDTNYPIPSDAYYVSPDGLDSNSGTSPSSPWPVTKALSSAPSGATIIFRGGTYRNVNAKIRQKLTLQAYPGEHPWLKGSVVVTGWVSDGAIWRVDGWNYFFPPNMDSRYIDPDYPLAGHCDMVYIDGRELKQVGSKAEVVPGTFYVDAARKQLYIGDNPLGRTVEATALTEAFTMWQGDSSNPNGTVIRGLGFAHYADEAIWVAAPNVTLENNTFVWNGLEGVTIVDDDNIVRGNTFSYNGRKGLGLHKADRTLLENNTISYNNVSRFAFTWDAAGIKVTKSDGVIASNNIVEHNTATAMWVDVSSTNATIVNNTIRDNSSIGVQLELSHQGIIASNVIYNNNTAGIMLADSSSVSVYNNTLSMNNTHVVVKDGPRYNTDPDEIARGIEWVTRDNVFKNNIFANTNGGDFFDASNCGNNNEKFVTMIAATDYNAYYRQVSSNPVSLIKWWPKSDDQCLEKYANLTDFKAATGFEANGLSFDGGYDPFFVNALAGDFRLKSGSPAIGRGTPLPPDIASAIGLPLGTSVDMGALGPKAVFISKAKPVSTYSRRGSDWFGFLALGKLSKWLGTSA